MLSRPHTSPRKARHSASSKYAQLNKASHSAQQQPAPLFTYIQDLIKTADTITKKKRASTSCKRSSEYVVDQPLNNMGDRSNFRKFPHTQIQSCYSAAAELEIIMPLSMKGGELKYPIVAFSGERAQKGHDRKFFCLLFFAF